MIILKNMWGTLWGTCFIKMAQNEMKINQKISKHWKNN